MREMKLEMEKETKDSKGLMRERNEKKMMERERKREM